MRQSLSPLLILGLALTAASAYAQQPVADSTTARVIQTLKGDLTNYLTMQERYYARHRAYAAATSQTELQPTTGVTVIVLSASSRGHNAVAIHRDRPDVVCAIWVGMEPRPPLYDGAAEGVPTCHGP